MEWICFQFSMVELPGTTLACLHDGVRNILFTWSHNFLHVWVFSPEISERSYLYGFLLQTAEIPSASAVVAFWVWNYKGEGNKMERILAYSIMCSITMCGGDKQDPRPPERIVWNVEISSSLMASNWSEDQPVWSLQKNTISADILHWTTTHTFLSILLLPHHAKII